MRSIERGTMIASVLFMTLLLLNGCQKELKESTGEYILQVKFNTTVDAQPLDTARIYTNVFNEDYKVTNFRFYVSNIRLRDAAGNSYNGDSYYLVDATNPASTVIAISNAEKRITRISFLVGVDSIRNVSGAQTGALDPARGMFWTWNSGYIMAKLEGISSFAATPNRNFTYHIGGFGGQQNALRTVSLDVAGGQEITLSEEGQHTLEIGVAIEKWFRAVHDLPIASGAFIHSPGERAIHYADNYATMFSVQSFNAE